MLHFLLRKEQIFPPKIIMPRYINLYSTSAKRLGLLSTSCHSSQCETRQPLSRLAAHSTARRLEGTERERERELKIRLTSCGQLAALPAGNDRVEGFFLVANLFLYTGSRSSGFLRCVVG